MGAWLAAPSRLLFGSNARIASLLIACSAMLWPGLAAGQTWVGAPNLSLPWSDPSNWSPATVPDGSANISIPQGDVQGDFSFTLANSRIMSINSPANLSIVPTTAITNMGAIDLAGRIVDNGTLVNADIGFIVMPNGSALTGSGTLSNAGVISTDAGQSVIG